MLLDEWGGGDRFVLDQNEEVEVSPTFLQLSEDNHNPKHRIRRDKGEKASTTFQQQRGPEEVEVVEDFLDFPSLDEDDLAKNKALEEDAEQADNSHSEERSSLEGTFLVTSQEDMRSNRNKREQVSLSTQADLARDNQVSRGKRARKSRLNHRRKVKVFKQVGMKNERKSDLAKEKVKLRKENKDLRRQNKRMKTVIEKLERKNRKKLNKSKESKGKRIKSDNARKCRNTEGCNEKWATFSSAAIGPAAAIIKQVRELFYVFLITNHFQANSIIASDRTIAKKKSKKDDFLEDENILKQALTANPCDGSTASGEPELSLFYNLSDFVSLRFA